MALISDLTRFARRRYNLWRFGGSRFSEKQKLDVSQQAKTRL